MLSPPPLVQCCCYVLNFHVCSCSVEGDWEQVFKEYTVLLHENRDYLYLDREGD